MDFVSLLVSQLCQRFEGLHLKPYLCPAGVPTIGYGATYYQNGRRVKLTDSVITKEEAVALLTWQVQNIYLPGALRICPGVTDPTLLAAVVDFAFNLGLGNLKASTLRKRVNAGLIDQVPAEFRKWVFVSGRKLRGLVLRREAEIRLFA